MEQGFKIVSLMAENFKKLKAVEIKPDGSMVMLTGRNGQGKSSVLDAIMAALCGKKLCPEKPVREGAEKGKVVVDMGSFKVIRTFTPDGGGSLKVESSDGFKASSPQAMLDKIVGEIAFDPMKFINEYDPRKQREVLMQLAGLDFSDIDEKIKDYKEKRSQLNLEKKRLGVELDKHSVLDYDDIPDKPVSVSGLAKQLEEIQEHNNSISARNSELQNKINMRAFQQQNQRESQKKVEELEDQLKQAKVDLREIKLDVEAKNEEIAELEKSLPKRKDTEAVKQAIANAEELNQKVAMKNEYQSNSRLLEQAQNEYSKLGEQIKGCEAQKAKGLSKANFPVDGLSVDDEGVIYEGIPLAQINDAKKLEIGVAVSMKLNPRLKVIRMKGNDLDQDSLSTIAKMVEVEGYQAWIEKVDESGKVGFVLEDGGIKATQ